MIKLKNKILAVAVLFSLIFLSVTVYAQPQIPTQIYGSINQTLPNGLSITFKIDNTIVGSGTISNGKYGYDLLIFLQTDDPLTSEKEGYSPEDNLTVFIDDITVENLGFLDSEKNNINLTIPENKYNQILEKNKKVISSGGCLNNYFCRDWNECSNGKQTRLCIDTSCSFNNKTETQYCTGSELEHSVPAVANISKPIFGSTKTPSYLFPIILSVVIVAIIIGAGFAIFKFINRPKTYKKGKEDLSKLKSYIIDARQKGFKDDYLKGLLLNSGWSKNQIDQAFKNL